MIAGTKPYGQGLALLEGAFSFPVPGGARRLAWDGLSFCVPSNWELADYRFPKKKSTRIEVEDEYSIRIEAEWVRTSGRLDLEEIMKRYEKVSKPLTVKAEEKTPLEGLPRGWHATRFTFKETAQAKEADMQVIRHELVTVFYLCPQNSIFSFFLLHFLPEDKEDPVQVTSMLAKTFQDHKSDDLMPWQLFDIAYRIPRTFSLLSSSFDIGSKLMVFGHRRRRLFIWTYSCADVFLKDENTPDRWAVGSLNGAKKFSGIVFRLDDQGKLSYRRKAMHPLGVRDEIGRWCFKYHLDCRLLKELNQLVVWVYHYRSSDDLWKLPPEFQPSR